MNKLSYQRLIEARYSYLQRHGISALEAKELDFVLEQDRPQREISFVELAKRTRVRARGASKGSKEVIFTGEAL
jgi:hypothetical protein